MGLATHKNNHSDKNNEHGDDSININSKQTKQQLRIHVRQIPFGGSPSLPFDRKVGGAPSGSASGPPRRTERQ